MWELIVPLLLMADEPINTEFNTPQRVVDQQTAVIGPFRSLAGCHGERRRLASRGGRGFNVETNQPEGWDSMWRYQNPDEVGYCVESTRTLVAPPSVWELVVPLTLWRTDPNNVRPYTEGESQTVVITPFPSADACEWVRKQLAVFRGGDVGRLADLPPQQRAGVAWWSPSDDSEVGRCVERGR